MPLPRVPSKVALYADRPIWPRDAIWHYTTAEGLKGILTDHVLWASSAAFMNDRKELSTGPDMLLNLLEHHKGELDNKIVSDVTHLARSTALTNRPQTFVACASKNWDNLTMWRNYTGAETGFAIGLRGSVGMRIRSQRTFDDIVLDAFQPSEAVIRLRRDAEDTAAHDFEWFPTVYGQVPCSGVGRCPSV